MNVKVVLNVLGKALLIEAVFMIFPLLAGVVYNENTYMNFLIPIILLLGIGLFLISIKPKDNGIFAKEGFLIVSLVWIAFSLFGSIPFVIGKEAELSSFINALFETISGFTTTGSSTLTDVTVISKSAMTWRILTHWLGGMGVLVFVLALLPSSTSGVMHVFRAESPGPSASKFVGKIKYTARVLYGIYILLTLIETLLLSFSGIGFYDSLMTALSTAGTGGFSLYNESIAYYGSAYIEMVVACFMLIFSINFNVYYLILIGGLRKAIKSEELRIFIIMLTIATLVIALNIMNSVGGFMVGLRYAFFQVTAISSTTGFATANFDVWPSLSKVIIFLLMFVGACGGSTGGGLKVSRCAILVKSSMAETKKTFFTRSVITTKFENKALNKEMVSSVRTFFIMYIFIILLSTLILSLDSFANGDIMTHFSASLTCISNVGPGFNAVGPTCNFASYSGFSKIVLSVVMLFGRLEIFPMMILFIPKTWRRS